MKADDVPDPSSYQFAYVNTTSDSQKDAAVNFAIQQKGEPYQISFGWDREKNYYPNWIANPDIRDPNHPLFDDYNYIPDDIYKEAWYCSELVWAGIFMN